jgi:hypothetical protein
VGARREGEDLARWLARSAPLSLALASVALGFPLLWAWPPRLCLPFISVSGGGDRRGDGTMPPFVLFSGVSRDRLVVCFVHYASACKFNRSHNLYPKILISTCIEIVFLESHILIKLLVMLSCKILPQSLNIYRFDFFINFDHSSYSKQNL